MATQSSVNLKITNNADGFDVSGGTVVRKITTSGGDIAMVGSGSITYTFPATGLGTYLVSREMAVAYSIVMSQGNYNF